MRYLSVTEIAKKWNVSERSVRNYCAHGRVNGAFLTGKTWNIPENAEKPERSNKKKEQPTTLLDILQEQKASKYSGGIYHKTQIDLTYNSNHIEGNRLTHDQTRYIFETNTIGVEKEVLNVDDVIETANHFRCIDMIIDNAKATLTEKFVKELHLILKNGTSDSRKDWFAIGDYKKMPNEVGGMDTALPEEVADKIKTITNKDFTYYIGDVRDIKKITSICHDKGIKVVVNTGRSAKYAVEKSIEAGLSEYVISSNGAEVYNYHERKSCSSGYGFSRNR